MKYNYWMLFKAVIATGKSSFKRNLSLYTPSLTYTLSENEYFIFLGILDILREYNGHNSQQNILKTLLSKNKHSFGMLSVWNSEV